MKVLFISSLFPNKAQPARGVYNLEQVRHLSEICDVKVIAGYFWFPFLKKGNKGAVLSDIPEQEVIHNIEVFHPKIFYTPKILRSLYGFFYYKSLLRFIKKTRADFDFDCIYTNWMYPDAYAAAKIAGYFNVPYTAMALGTDINEYLYDPARREKILHTARHSAKTLTVSSALRQKLIDENIPDEHIEVLYDGVDHELFCPLEKTKACEKLGLDPNKKRILYIGSIESWKGPGYLARAGGSIIKKYPDIQICIIGEGPYNNELKGIIDRHGLKDNILLLNNQPHEKIPLWMNASDILCLPSTMEGVPNVVLEALACGVPIVASNVGGLPEVLRDEKTGILVEPKNVSGLSQALAKALSNNWDRNYIREYSKKFCWKSNARRLREILLNSLEK